MYKTTLKDLAFHSWNGACNVRAIINGLQEASTEIPTDLEKLRDLSNPESVYLRMIIPQIAYLVGESIGPSDEAVAAYLKLVEAEKEAAHG